MEQNKFATAGWLAVVQAILFPLGFVVGIIQAGLGVQAFDFHGPIVGPADLIMIAFTVIGIYTMLMFRRLLNERYDNHDIDLLIIISIWWGIVFQIISIALKLIVIFLWPVDKVVLVVTYIVIMTASMVTIGIVDILIAVRLLRVKEIFNEMIRALAYVIMAAGICEITVFLTPLALLLVPVTCVLLAIIFLRADTTVEFV
jgi:hypothetical protein